MTGEKLRYIALHTAGAIVFIFVLNHMILKTDLRTAIMWSLGFGAIAFSMAFRHMRDGK